jgi:hypothetical protein
VSLVQDRKFHGRTKHIDVKQFAVRDWIKDGEFEVRFIGTDNQRADALTKPLAKVKFREHRDKMGVRLCR